jgi:methionine synthase I (cobalamin-dependent)
MAAVSTLAGQALGVPLGVRRARDEAAGEPDRFGADISQAMQRGARIVGGARGTTPDHVRALAVLVRSRAAA